MKDMRQMTQMGRRIENSSFSIIDQEVGPHRFCDETWQIVRRIIHSTGDFEFKDLTYISDGAVDAALQAFNQQCPIIADVKMIQVGLNQDRLAQYGCKSYSFISDEDVITRAKH